jgi:transposase
VVAPEELTRDELIGLARCQDAQITTMAGRMAELLEANEGLSVKLAQLEHLLSRNSRNSSSPPSK